MLQNNEKKALWQKKVNGEMPVSRYFDDGEIYSADYGVAYEEYIYFLNMGLSSDEKQKTR